MLVLEWLLDLFLNVLYLVVGLLYVLVGFLIMKDTEPDKKLHCWVGCAIVVILFIPLHFILAKQAFASWFWASLVALAFSFAKEIFYDFWIRKTRIDFYDVLATLRGIAQASIWCWAYMLVRSAFEKG